MKKQFSLLIIALVGSIGTMFGATAATGVFTVAAGKTVQFANANEVELVQWSTANAWREEQKNAEGHNGWFVLDHNEWTYLLVTRDGEGMSKNAEGKVNGKKGLIILPDDWLQPAGVPAFHPVSEGISYENNVYTTGEWSLMADAGAIFLPCEGYKEGDVIKNPTDHGAYWSSDPCSESNGYSVHFNEGDIHDCNTFASKDLYYSVILVREVVILDEEDNLATFTTKLAAADDCSFAYVRRTLRKDGTFYTLCLPFDVPDIEDSPLAGAEVFTFDGGTVSGAAGSEVLHLTLTPLAGTRLSAGVPYILRWANTGETLATPLYFASVENWDDDTDAGTDSGNETIKLRGVYPKAHIPGYTSGAVAHYNFFMGANNTLYWPDDTLYPEAQGYNMKGFRAYFYIIPPTPSPARQYSNMQAVWDIKSGLNSTTGVEEVRSETVSTVRSEKILHNGQVVLVIDGKMYDLQGKVIDNR